MPSSTYEKKKKKIADSDGTLSFPDKNVREVTIERS